MRKINKLQSTEYRVQSTAVSACLLILFLAVFSGCAKKEIKNTASTGENIICFGDSLTFGYGTVPEQAYPAALAKMVSIPVINAGIDGDTTTEAVKRLDADVLERNPLLVIVEFGGNDFLRKVPIDITLKNLEEMIDRIQAGGAMVALVDISAGMFLAEYRGNFKKLALEKGAIFIPGILSGIITNPSLKSDFLHPNGQGYQIIADKICRKINPYLDNTNPISAEKK